MDKVNNIIVTLPETNISSKADSIFIPVKCEIVDTGNYSNEENINENSIIPIGEAIKQEYTNVVGLCKNIENKSFESNILHESLGIKEENIIPEPDYVNYSEDQSAECSSNNTVEFVSVDNDVTNEYSEQYVCDPINTKEGKILFPCNFCGKSFTSAEFSERHKKRCKKAPNLGSTVKKQLVAATMIHNIENTTCTTFFSQSSNQTQSIQQNTDDKCSKQIKHDKVVIDIICNFCGRAFISIKYCERHKKRCKASPHRKTIVSKMQYNEETQTKLNSNNSSLNHSNYSTSHSDDQQHIQLRTKKYIHKCIECNQTFSTINDLKIHSESHKEDKRFKCNQCGKISATSTNLIEHMRLHTGERPFKCSQCDKAYAVARQLTEHIRTHTGERPYVCYYCDKAYSRAGPLTEHMRLHTGERPFKCTECEKSFTKSTNLIQHMRVHTGEKPFTCSYCDKTFNSSGNLSEHIRSHTGERPFPCRFCDKTFARSTHLRLHERSHTGEKPYKCKKCDKAFAQSCQLKVHMKLHISNTPV